MAEPEYGRPDEDNPEITPDRFAYALRHDGTAVNPRAYARATLVRLQNALGKSDTDDVAVAKTLRHVKAALAEMEQG